MKTIRELHTSLHNAGEARIKAYHVLLELKAEWLKAVIIWRRANASWSEALANYEKANKFMTDQGSVLADERYFNDII